MLWLSCFFFFFNDTATTEIYTLSLHDALPISSRECGRSEISSRFFPGGTVMPWAVPNWPGPSPFPPNRSEEHTSELQSRPHLVCRLLLEKKNKDTMITKHDEHSIVIAPCQISD